MLKLTVGLQRGVLVDFLTPVTLLPVYELFPEVLLFSSRQVLKLLDSTMEKPMALCKFRM